MPVKKFACPPGKPTYGKAFDPVYCITKCPHQCMSPYLMAAIAASAQRNHHKGRYLSATSLSGCARRLKLERTEDYAEYYHNLYYSFRGTITHTVVEESALVDLGDGKSMLDYGFLSEWRMQIGFCFEHGGFPIPTDLDPSDVASIEQIECPQCMDAGTARADQETFILGGTLDGAEALWEQFDSETGVLLCKLHDLKTMQEYAVGYFVKGDPKNTLHPTIKDAYVIQARIYAYLASRSIPPAPLLERGVRQLKMVESHIQAFAMGQAPWTGGGTFRWKDHYRNPVKDWPMYPIDLADDAWIEEFIKAKARPIYDSLLLNKTRGPVCEPEKSSKGYHSWACEFCAFHGTKHCPNPALEYKLIQEGMDAEEAFRIASESPVEIVEEDAAPLTENDTANIDAFFAKQRGEAIPTPAPKKKKKAKAVKVPTLRVDGEKSPLLSLAAGQAKLIKEMEQHGYQIHEELQPKRQSLVIKPTGEPTNVKAPGAKVIDGLVKAGWLEGTLATSGNFVRWQVRRD